jgi:mannitol/fructose-specific phosphotransferase system IIA component (Ntr-type)
MKKVLLQLIQWQDLLEARDQQATLAPGARLDQLDEAIAAMPASLDPELVNRFIRIQKKGRLAIVPVSNKTCTGCGLVLPISLVHRIRAETELLHCPNCSRFLFEPEGTSPRRTPKNQESPQPARIGIARFSAPELMITPLAAGNGEAAIRELCARIESCGYVERGDRLAEEALKREAIVSTALDVGAAFPHVRGVEGGALILAAGVSPRGIRFAGGPRTPVRLVFFFAIPTAASAFYLRLLAGLARVVGQEEIRDKLLAAATPELLWKALVQSTRKVIP